MLRTLARRRNENGFTLIELLIVIIILGVLAAIVVFSVRGITNNAAATACEIEIRTVETAIEAHKAELGTYPGTVGALTDAGFLREDPVGESNITDATTIVVGTGAFTTAPGCDA
ncbi:prepilin-type N-terminal cleavage/methylation domain-containing protein [Nocardioides sp. WS12]|uniref:prepilin-type N-terminal cleavage/methylation domain-containing protein n=1 Tax=Nocardioides sp. WS12 TaxID=2486272 RepID=UPI0015FC28AF|nr:prepilin-type N-terminal cleavage/methylation domain-containing protein [Nocardioides sp. WS12]